MASQVRVEAKVFVDNREVRRLSRTVSVDEVAPPYAELEKADDDGTFSAFSANQDLDELQVVLIAPDRQITARLDAQSDAGIVINANGFVLLVDVDIDAGAATNLNVSNDSGATAKVGLFAAGT